MARDTQVAEGKDAADTVACLEWEERAAEQAEARDGGRCGGGGQVAQDVETCPPAHREEEAAGRRPDGTGWWSRGCRGGGETPRRNLVGNSAARCLMLLSGGLVIGLTRITLLSLSTL